MSSFGRRYYRDGNAVPLREKEISSGYISRYSEAYSIERGKHRKTENIRNPPRAVIWIKVENCCAIIARKALLARDTVTTAIRMSENTLRMKV